MDISFCKLKTKEVVNICDGRNLGNIIDMVMDSCTGKIIGIVVPCDKKFFSIFKSNNEIFIPYNRICKIGQDILKQVSESYRKIRNTFRFLLGNVFDFDPKENKVELAKE